MLGLVVLGSRSALFVAFFRETYIDRMGVVLCVLAMSISMLLYIIGGQFLIGKLLRWFPISGFDPSPAVIVRFLALPLLVGLADGIGGSVRFYRTVFVEESGRDYVRTARAKGCGDARVMTRHVLRNALIPILTQRRGGDPVPVHRLAAARVLLRHPGARLADRRRDQRQRLRDAARDGLHRLAALHRRRRSRPTSSYTLVDPRVRLE